MAGSRPHHVFRPPTRLYDADEARELIMNSDSDDEELDEMFHDFGLSSGDEHDEYESDVEIIGNHSGGSGAAVRSPVTITKRVNPSHTEINRGGSTGKQRGGVGVSSQSISPPPRISRRRVPPPAHAEHSDSNSDSDVNATDTVINGQGSDLDELPSIQGRGIQRVRGRGRGRAGGWERGARGRGRGARGRGRGVGTTHHEVENNQGMLETTQTMLIRFLII